jgi:lysine 2,3-aminomutase
MTMSTVAAQVGNPRTARRTTGVPLHRRLRDGEWWRTIPAWKDVDAQTFHDHRWQLSNTVTQAAQLGDLLGERAKPVFVADLDGALARATMAMRVTPYSLSLVDWDDPFDDPIRRQFIPLQSEHEADHPMSRMDALAEQKDAVVPGLTHRYPDKVLLLCLDVCPTLCRCCTRSYSVGADTEQVSKCHLRVDPKRWEKAFRYLRQATQVEDVVVSGGDVGLLSGAHLRLIGDALLEMPHIRRIRFATRAPAVLPQKLLSDRDWSDALGDIAARGRKRGKHICVHTHFDHPDEITETTRQACDSLFQRGIAMRNQSVLLAGVNDDLETMITLIRRLAWINVEPYYVYLHDVVPGDDALRTSLAVAVELEKKLRGQTAGFMTPTFVCDALGGGGKRELHSYEHYDQQTGIAVYRSPVVDPDRPFFSFDPLRTLPANMRWAWRSKAMRQSMVAQAVAGAGM